MTALDALFSKAEPVKQIDELREAHVGEVAARQTPE
jgi:hypothetical protein